MFSRFIFCIWNQRNELLFIFTSVPTLFVLALTTGETLIFLLQNSSRLKILWYVDKYLQIIFYSGIAEEHIFPACRDQQIFIFPAWHKDVTKNFPGKDWRYNSAKTTDYKVDTDTFFDSRNFRFLDLTYNIVSIFWLNS